MSRRRVVITGLGLVSPVGNDVATGWANLVAGKSGIDRITRFDPSALSAQIAGEVKGFDVAAYMPARAGTPPSFAAAAAAYFAARLID